MLELRIKQGKVLSTEIFVYEDKSFDFIIKTPPAAVQLLELAKVKKGSAESNRVKCKKFGMKLKLLRKIK